MEVFSWAGPVDRVLCYVAWAFAKRVGLRHHRYAERTGSVRLIRPVAGFFGFLRKKRRRGKSFGLRALVRQLSR
eukprot:COSAG04_NODE_24747_length_317_cov_0.949541_1_plen_74_part_00